MPVIPIVDEEVNQIAETICEMSPSIRPHLSDSRTLREYACFLRTIDAVPGVHVERQTQLQAFLKERVGRLMPDYVEPVRRLRDRPLVCSCVDHHGVLTNTFNVSANLVPLLSGWDAAGPPAVVFTTAAVPLNNGKHKRGFLYRGRNVILFGHGERHQTSYAKEKFEFGYVERLLQTRRHVGFSDREMAFLEWYESFLRSSRSPNARNYREQVQSIVARQWPLLFEEPLRPYVPPLLYMPQEDAARALFEPMLAAGDSDHFLWRTLFDAAFRNRVLDQFRGIRSAWNEAKPGGTHFFWYIGDDGEMVRAFVEGDCLVPQHDRYRKRQIPLTPDAILDAVRREVLCPALFYCYAWLVFWAGVRPLLGKKSVGYMTAMKAAWHETLRPTDPEEAERIAGIDTSRLVEGPLLAYARNGHGRLVPQTATDLIAAGGLQKQYLERVSQLPLSDVLRAALVDFYETEVPHGRRTELSFTASDLAERAFCWVSNGTRPLEALPATPATLP